MMTNTNKNNKTNKNKSMTVAEAGSLGGKKIFKTYGAKFFVKIGRKGGKASVKTAKRNSLGQFKTRGRSSS